MTASPFAAAAMDPEFSPEATALVGVSGGRDSVALLHWLHSKGCRHLVVCHLDHALRAESRADADFVRKLAAQFGCKCEIARTDVKALARRTKQSTETAARGARHAFFARCAKRHRCSTLFLAHHADDQVETFLFNLLRGAGPGGMVGMALLGKIGALTVARPLLGVWRKEVDAYCTEHELEWCEDASNATREYTRNRLRHDALPALSTAMGRDVRRALWRAAELLRAEDEVISAHAAPQSEMGKDLEVAALQSLPTAIQRRLIHAWLTKAKVESFGYEEVEAVRSLLEMHVAKVNLPGARCARRRAGKIFLAEQRPSVA